MTPDAYAAFTERLRERLEADERVVGLVALGSMAAVDYRPDAFSDHDFFVVTHAGAQPAMRADRSWLPDAERIVLHFAETEHGVKALYDDGHLLEFAVFDDAELGLAKVNRYRVLFDRAHVARRMDEVREATVVSNERGARGDVWLVGQLLTNLLVGVGRHRRGERLSGDLYAKSHAVGHLLTLVARHVPSAEAGLLDDLDPFRRFERAYPEIGAAIGAALLEETPAAAIGLLDVVESALAGRVDLPVGAIAAVRRAAGA